VRRDQVPERGVDRVVLGLLAGVRETIRHHALGHRRRPGEQDIARQLKPIPQAHEPAQRDESVAAPVREPWVAGDDRLAGTPAHHVGIGRALQRCLEPAPAPRFRVQEPCRVQIGRGLARAQHQRGIAAVQGPGEHAGRGEILGEIEPALALGIILEAAIPCRLVPIAAVDDGRDRRHARVRPPQHARAGDLSGEIEGLVLMVQGVIVAAREERAYNQLDGARQRAQVPAHDDMAALVAGDHLLAHFGAVLGAEDPAGPGSL
jgi:hypothetical protein